MKLINSKIKVLWINLFCSFLIFSSYSINTKSLKFNTAQETNNIDKFEYNEVNRNNGTSKNNQNKNLNNHKEFKINFKFANTTLILQTDIQQEINKYHKDYNKNSELIVENRINLNSSHFYNKNEKNIDKSKRDLMKNNLNDVHEMNYINRNSTIEKNLIVDLQQTSKDYRNISNFNLENKDDKIQNKANLFQLNLNKRIESLLPALLNSRSHDIIEIQQANVNLRANSINNYLYRVQNNFNNQISSNVDMSKLSYQCAEIGCEWCEKINIKICKQCKYGFFMYMGKCYTICPKDYIADIYTRSCRVLDNTNVMMQIAYVKSFSVGSCKNICGKVGIDCSCTQTCIQEGNCCADYNYCENLNKINQNRNHECYEGNPRCDLCENFVRKNDPTDVSKIIPYKCGKCREGYFLKYGECKDKCDSSDKVISPNQICFDTMSCLVDNCAQCAQENSAVCRICENGTYLHNNQCLKECPYGLRADRISWTCLEPPLNAWYWIWPSKSGCRLRCGRRIDFEMDCSCAEDCFSKGNCCADVEDYCPQFSTWK